MNILGSLFMNNQGPESQTILVVAAALDQNAIGSEKLGKLAKKG